MHKNSTSVFLFFQIFEKEKDTLSRVLSSGADNEIRTHDLVITNDVLCQLSYISITAYKLYQRNYYLSIEFFKNAD